MGSESSADPPLCGEKPPELQLQATGYWSRHEKFTADINKSESKARVTRSPPPPFWSQQGERHTLGAGAPNYSGCVEWKRKKLQTEEGEDQTAESPSALEKGESGLEPKEMTSDTQKGMGNIIRELQACTFLFWINILIIIWCRIASRLSLFLNIFLSNSPKVNVCAGGHMT